MQKEYWLTPNQADYIFSPTQMIMLMNYSESFDISTGNIHGCSSFDKDIPLKELTFLP